MRSSGRRRVVITGLGPVSPVGVGRQAFWEAILAGTSGTSPLTELPGNFPVHTLRSRVVARVPDQLLPEDVRRSTDRRSLLAERALELVLADAGLSSLAGEQSALVMGNAVGAPVSVEAAFLALDRGPSGDGPMALGASLASPGGPQALLRQLSFHTVADELAALCHCEGSVLTVSTGCTAALDAISLAFDLIRAGTADVVVAGSAEAPLTPMVFAAFDVIGATTRRNAEPATASRPFDKDRDGFVLGEGAALLLLEEREHARARRARVYAEITGCASTSNAYHMTNLAADGLALAGCMRLALEDAGLPPEAIDHINAHGSSTPQNDLCETNAIKTVLGERAHGITVNSLKSMLGHALGASNALEVAACALSLHAQHHFPTINLDSPGPGCDLDYVARQARKAGCEHLLKLSNGFSGIHSALVLKAA